MKTYVDIKYLAIDGLIEVFSIAGMQNKVMISG